MATAGAASAAGSIPAAPASIQELVSTTGVDDASCGTNTYTGTAYRTINAAMAAASSGDTIYLCAGTYDESVRVNANVTLDGAQHGTTASPSRGPESVIDTPVAPGIAAFTNNGDGYTWDNNLITNNSEGTNFNTTGTAGGDQGYGIFFTSGPASNITISNNSFSQNTGPDIKTGAATHSVTGSRSAATPAPTRRTTSSFWSTPPGPR